MEALKTSDSVMDDSEAFSKKMAHIAATHKLIRTDCVQAVLKFTGRSTVSPRALKLISFDQKVSSEPDAKLSRQIHSSAMDFMLQTTDEFYALILVFHYCCWLLNLLFLDAQKGRLPTGIASGSDPDLARRLRARQCTRLYKRLKTDGASWLTELTYLFLSHAVACPCSKPEQRSLDSLQYEKKKKSAGKNRIVAKSAIFREIDSRN